MHLRACLPAPNADVQRTPRLHAVLNGVFAQRLEQEAHHRQILRQLVQLQVQSDQVLLAHVHQPHIVLRAARFLVQRRHGAALKVVAKKLGLSM